MIAIDCLLLQFVSNRPGRQGGRRYDGGPSSDNRRDRREEGMGMEEEEDGSGTVTVSFNPINPPTTTPRSSGGAHVIKSPSPSTTRQPSSSSTTRRSPKDFSSPSGNNSGAVEGSTGASPGRLNTSRVSPAAGTTK